MRARHQRWDSLAAVAGVDPGMEHQHMREGVSRTRAAHYRLYRAEQQAVFVEEPELIGVVRGLQVVGKDMCREKIMGGLRRESGWDQVAEAKRMNYAGPKIDPELDTGMVRAAVGVGWPDDILPLVARARRLCYGRPFH